MKRMKHANHGFHDAMSASEETELKKSGWIEDDGSALKNKLALIHAKETATEVEFKEVRRGRPPNK